MTPEGKVKAKVKEIITAYKPHVYSHWPVLNGMGEPALDCYGCADGEFFSVETKAHEGDRLTPRQLLTANKITKAGGPVFRVYGKDELALAEFDAWLHERVMRKIARGKLKKYGGSDVRR